MGRIIWTFVLSLVLGLAGFVTIRLALERGVGTGPVETAPRPRLPTRDVAFVANALDGTVSLVALDTVERLRDLDVTPDGKKVGVFRDPTQALVGQARMERQGINYAQDTDVSPDGTVLYVSRGHLGDVAAFDIASGNLMWRQPIGGFRADHMALSPDGRRLFISALTDGQVEVIDTARAARVGSFATGPFPHDIHVSPDGARVYVASLGDLTLPPAERADPNATGADAPFQITVADARTLEVVDRYVFEAAIRPFAVALDGSRVYAQLSNAHAVVRYGFAARRVTDRLELPVADGVGPSDWDFEAPHHGLTLDPSENTLCLAGRASDYAALVNVRDFSLRATVPVGDAPGWAATSPDGLFCVLANGRSGDMSVVSFASAREVARVAVGRGAKHITTASVPLGVLAGETPPR